MTRFVVVTGFKASAAKHHTMQANTKAKYMWFRRIYRRGCKAKDASMQAEGAEKGHTARFEICMPVLYTDSWYSLGCPQQAVTEQRQKRKTRSLATHSRTAADRGVVHDLSRLDG